MSISTVSLNTFDGGMVYDPRDPSSNASRTLKHFDAFTNKYRLTPYRSSESGDSGAATHIIQNFDYDGTTIFGLGTGVTGSSTAGVYTRTNFTDATWTALINVAGSAIVAADYSFFTFYRTTGKLYGVRGARYVWSVDPTGPSANNVEADLTSYTNVSNGLVHSKDDILYFGYDNKIASNNNGSWTVAALTLPTDIIISSISEYGNYLAIGCRSKSGIKSRVYLWDRNTSLTTLSEVIDWGEGNLMILEELEGALIGVSFEGTTGSFNINAHVVFRYYSGSGAIKFQEFIGSSQTIGIQANNFKRKVRNRIFFSASIPIVTTSYYGIWSIGRSSENVPFAVTLDRLVNNDTGLGSSGSVFGFIYLGDYMFTTYQDTTGTFHMDKTDDQANYTATSIYETTINPQLPEHRRASAGSRSRQKALLGVALSVEPIVSGRQAVLKYRVDGGSWVTILTISTVGIVVQESTFDASGSKFKNGREYEFRIESTGGAVITELKYKYEDLDTQV